MNRTHLEGSPMMTLSNGNIFRVTGHLCGEFTGDPGEFPTQRPVRRNFDVFFDLRPKKLLNKQSWGWWFETLLRPLWRHYDVSNWWAGDAVLMSAALAKSNTLCHTLPMHEYGIPFHLTSDHIVNNHTRFCIPYPYTKCFLLKHIYLFRN